MYHYNQILGIKTLCNQQANVGNGFLVPPEVAVTFRTLTAAADSKNKTLCVLTIHFSAKFTPVMSNPQQQNSSQDQDQDQGQGSSALSPTAHSNNVQISQPITVNGDRVEEEHEEMHQSHDLEDDDDEEEEDDSQDYYDPHGDIARYHEQKLEIEESWLEWERQAQANSRQNYIFQKPGSAKRRDRRERYEQLQMHRQGSPSSSSSSSGTVSGSASAPGLVDPGSSSDSLAAIERLRRLGSYRPALASSIVHSYSNLSWEAVQAAREKRLAAKAIASGSG